MDNANAQDNIPNTMKRKKTLLTRGGGDVVIDCNA